MWLHLGWKTSAHASGKETLLPPMYNTCSIFNLRAFELMAMIGTMGKLRMVKAMTGMAMPRIRLLKTIYVQTLTALSIFSISCLRKRFSQSS